MQPLVGRRLVADTIVDSPFQLPATNRRTEKVKRPGRARCISPLPDGWGTGLRGAATNAPRRADSRCRAEGNRPCHAIRGATKIRPLLSTNSYLGLTP
jgi:hypothetical protein